MNRLNQKENLGGAKWAGTKFSKGKYATFRKRWKKV